MEANWAMNAGDIGRLMNIWKLWLVMSQSLKGLNHYLLYLPQLVLMLTQLLPPSLSKLFRHQMLVSPSGRPNHFVAKDFFLENQNYWLKYFYNRGGIGTEVKRLSNLFSLNIRLVSFFLTLSSKYNMLIRTELTSSSLSSIRCRLIWARRLFARATKLS